MSVDAAGNGGQGGGTADSFALAQRIAEQAGPTERVETMAIGLGLLFGAALFIVAAVLGERNVLWIPGAVLIVAAVGSLVA